MDTEHLEEGDTVSIEFTAESEGARFFGRTGRRTIGGTVDEVSGSVVYVSPDVDDSGDLQLVVDPDGDVWARERDEPSTDSYYGSNAVVG